MLIESKYNRMYMPSLPSKMGNRPRPTVWECTPPRPADPEGQLRASLDAHCAGTPIHDAQERNVLQVLPSISKLKSHAKQKHSNKAHPSTCRYDVSCHLPNEVQVSETRSRKAAGSHTAVNMQMQWQRRVNRNVSRPQRHALGTLARCARSDSPMVRPKEP